MMTPELYQSMLSRGSEFANSRIVLGVHYPLDIIASRSLASYDLSQAFTNPDYINNATTTGTAINLPSSFTAAAPELNSFLSAGCGASVASCAASQVNPYAPSAANAATYANNLTYGLPTLTLKQAPQEAAPTGGPDASILLATIYGGSSATAKALANAANGGTDGSGLLGNLATSTVNQIVVNTETNALAAFYGTSLSYWSRINLNAAAGYFQGVTGGLALASTDVVKTNVTIDADGKLGGTGTVAGNVTNAGGAIAPGGVSKPGDAPGVLTITGDLTESQPSELDILLGTQSSQLIVDGAASLLGNLDVSLAEGFSLTSGETFDIVGTGDGLTNGLTSFSLDGVACGADGGGFKCNGGDVFDIFSWSVVPGTTVGGLNPEDLAAERHRDAGARGFDLGDDAGRIRGPWLREVPGFAKDHRGGLNTRPRLGAVRLWRDGSLRFHRGLLAPDPPAQERDRRADQRCFDEEMFEAQSLDGKTRNARKQAARQRAD